MTLFYQLIVNLIISRSLLVHGSRLMAHGSWANGQGGLARPQGARPQVRFRARRALGHKAGPLCYEPLALSHEPRTVDNRLVDLLTD